MKPTDKEPTRREEDIADMDFDAEELRDENKFGNWPEIIGLIFTLFVVWLIFAFRG